MNLHDNYNLWSRDLFEYLKCADYNNQLIDKFLEIISHVAILFFNTNSNIGTKKIITFLVSSEIVTKVLGYQKLCYLLGNIGQKWYQKLPQ